MKRTILKGVMTLAAVAALTSCVPIGDVSVGYDVGFDCAPGYVSVGTTLPIAVTNPYFPGPVYGPGFAPVPLAPRPVSGPAVLPPTPVRPGPIVGGGGAPGPVRPPYRPGL